MILRKRLFSAVTAAALLATSVLPSFGGLVFAANEAPAEPLKVPTSVSPPTNLSVTEAPYNSPTMYLYYTASPDWLDFIEAFRQTKWNEDGNKTTSPFGSGFQFESNFNMQTDYRIDGGAWHYDESWDTTRYGVADSYSEYFDGSEGGACEANYVRLINGYEMAPSYADQENYLHDAFASLYLTETDGEDNYYRFDFDNHQLEFRCRYFAKLTQGGYYDDNQTEEREYYIYSDWSDTVRYGKGEGAQYSPAKELDAPVLENLTLLPEQGYDGAPAISYFTKSPASVLSLLNAPYQNKATGLPSSTSSVYINVEASLDGENWTPISYSTIANQRTRELDVWDIWDQLYRKEGDHVYAMPTMPVYLRAQYTASIEQDGGAAYELSSDWSKPVSITIDGLDSFQINVTHAGMGADTYHNTQSFVSTENREMGYINCYSIEGCYVQKVTVDGKLFYDKDDEATHTLLNWSTNFNYFKFHEEANPEYFLVTKDTEIVITYGGTPTEEKTITLTYNEGGYLFPTNWPNPNEETGLYTDTCKVFLGQDQTIDVHVYDGFELVSVKVDGVENAQAMADLEFTFPSVMEDHTVEATFKRVAYPVYVNCQNSSNGTITYPAGYTGSGTYFPIGTDLEFVVTPNIDEETGKSFLIESIRINDKEQLTQPTTEPYTIKLEKMDCEYRIGIILSEKLPTYYTLNASVGSAPESGVIYGNGEQSAEGTSMHVSWKAAEGYAFEKLVVDGEEIKNISGDNYIFPDVKANHTVVVYFKSTYVPKQFLLTVTSHDASGLNTVTPNGQVPTTEDGSQTIAFTPHEGYYVSALLIDGKALTAAEIEALKGSYTFTNISADNSFEVTFAPILYTVTFQQPDGTVIDTQTVAYGKGATAPVLKEYMDAKTGVLYQVHGWDTAFNAVFSDLTVTATYFIASYEIASAPATLTYDISKGDLPLDLTGLTIQERITYYPESAGKESTTTKGITELKLKLSAQTAGEASKDVADPTKTPVSVAVVLDQYAQAYEIPAGSFSINVTRAAQEHLVTFKNYDGTVIDTVSVADGTAATAPTGFARSFALDGGAMAFIRWDKDFTNVTEDMTVTAVFRKETIVVSTPPTKLTYDITGGKLDQAIDFTGMKITRTYTWYPAGSDADATKTLSAEGYKGLVYSAANLKELDATNPVVTVFYTPVYNTKLKLEAGNFTLKLQDNTQTEYTVTFVDHDGTVLQTAKIPAGEAAVAPATRSFLKGNSYWMFNAWDQDFSKITSDLTVTAVYMVYELSLVTPPTKTEYTLTPGAALDFSGLTAVLRSYRSKEPVATVTADLAFDNPQLRYSLTKIPADAKAGTLDVTVSYYLESADVAIPFADLALALKTAEPDSYVITYQDADGTILGTQTVSGDDKPVYPEIAPYVQSGNTTKAFVGWDTLTDADGNQTVTAMYLTYTLQISALPAHTRYLLAKGDVTIDLSGMELTLTGVYSSPKAGEDFTRTYSYDLIESMVALPFSTIAEDYTGDLTLEMNVTITLSNVPIASDALKLDIYKMGDLDRNGVVDTNDAIIVLKDYSHTILGMPTTLSEAQLLMADTDGNGVINTTDAILILKQFAASLLGNSIPWRVNSRTF